MHATAGGWAPTFKKRKIFQTELPFCMPPLVVGHLPPGWRKEGEPVSHEKKGNIAKSFSGSPQGEKLELGARTSSNFLLPTVFFSARRGRRGGGGGGEQEILPFWRQGRKEGRDKELERTKNIAHRSKGGGGMEEVM